MCGIFSYIGRYNLTEEQINYSRYKTKQLNHRGPDHYNEWFYKNIFLGIQRLSINDLSENGNQPFVYEDKVLIFNGEFYNYKYYQTILEEKGYKFKSNCDTEVFFYFLIEFGFENLDKINGMFSFIYFDGNNIHFGNDIFSEKTLFYYKNNSKIIISSELSNLIDLSKKKFDKKIIYSYLSFGHLIDDKTFYENIFKLKPGQILTIDKKLDIKEFKYFDPKKFYLNHRKSIGEKNIKLNLFHEHIENSLKLKFNSDREIGLLFSGGLDSTIVMDQIISSRGEKLKIATYTNNKMDFQIQNQIDKHVNQIFVSDDDLQKNNESIINLFGQPMDSFTSLAIENLCLELSKKNINCALSGIGGDELYFGYNKYYDYKSLKFKLKNYYKIGFNKLASSLISKGYITEFIKSKNYKLWINEIFKSNKNFSLTENLFFNDMEFFLPNSRCLTNDVASMRHSVELRGSFLDIEMLKIILSFDLNELVSLGQKKILINFHSNKFKNFNNYNKYPFFLRPDQNSHKDIEISDFIKSIFPENKINQIDSSLKNRADMLLTFFS